MRRERALRILKRERERERERERCSVTFSFEIFRTTVPSREGEREEEYNSRRAWAPIRLTAEGVQQIHKNLLGFHQGESYRIRNLAVHTNTILIYMV